MNGIYPDYVAGSNRQPSLSLYPDWMDVLTPYGPAGQPIRTGDFFGEKLLEEDELILLIIQAFMSMKK